MHRRPSLIDTAVASLREHVTSGRWPVGTRIPTEPELAEQLGVGRNTVREAVQSLAHAGLLDRRQGSGTFVVASDELTVALRRRAEGASTQDVLDVLRALETEIARLAARRRTESEAAALHDLAARREQELRDGDLDAVRVSDRVVRTTLHEASHSPVLAAFHARIVAMTASGATGVDAAPDDLVEAVEIGDEEAAARAAHHRRGPELTEALPGAATEEHPAGW